MSILRKLQAFLKYASLNVYTTLRKQIILFFTPLTEVAIEINSSCNRRCRFCPNFDHTREVAFLEDELFYKIIAELKEMHFRGAITWNLFNEPLLDKRLPEFIEHARRELPRAYLTLSTNGDLLDLPMWAKLRKAGLDFVNITLYEEKLNDNIKFFLDKLDKSENRHLSVHRLYSVCNRGGLVKTNMNIKLPLKRCCLRPSYSLCVNYKGKAVLCCNDYLGQVELGDLNKETIPVIWQKQSLKHYRRRLFFKDRGHLELCKVCDEP